MNEMDILKLFYDEMVARSATRENVFLSIDNQATKVLSEKLSEPVSIEQAQKLTNICIANQWLERTTADPGYNFLSLTEAGLQMVLSSQYL